MVLLNPSCTSDHSDLLNLTLTGREEGEKVLPLFFKIFRWLQPVSEALSPTEKAWRLRNILGDNTLKKKQHVPKGVTGQPGFKACWAEQQPRARFDVYTLTLSSGCHSNSPQHSSFFLFAVLCYDLKVLGNLNGLLHSFSFSANCSILCVQ